MVDDAFHAYLPASAPCRRPVNLEDDPEGFALWFLTESPRRSLLSMLSPAMESGRLSRLEVRSRTLTWRYPNEERRDPIILPLAEINECIFCVSRYTLGPRLRGELRLRLRNTMEPLSLGPFSWERVGAERAEALYRWAAAGIGARAHRLRAAAADG